MTKTINLSLVLICLLSCLSGSDSLASDKIDKRPKLLVLIAIDQFRADFLTRFYSKFLPVRQAHGEVGGFKYLMSQGAYFPMGQYDLMQSITGPGHATMLTGAYPFQDGIPLNGWYDSTLKRPVNCVEDTDSPLLTSHSSNPSDGRSPRNLFASTVGDELKNAGFPSKVVSVALKDRSAIFMGGHRADVAIWFDSKASEWTSSQYYFPNKELPAWIKRLNQETLPAIGKVIEWKAKGVGSGYTDEDSSPYLDESNASRYGKTFPHSIAFGKEFAVANPFGLQLTETAAERAFEAHHLGQGNSTDILAVSFSSHDMVGHTFGPNSREIEEMTIAEDRVLAQLLNFLRRKVPGGLNQIVIAFTADHGVAPTPEWAKAHKMDAGRIDTIELSRTISNRLNEKFGKPSEGNWISYETSFHFYLNLAEIRSKKIDKTAMESEAKAVIEKDPRVAFVFTLSDYRARKLPPGIHERQIFHSYYPGRSGDIVLIPKPLFVPTGATTNHVTGYGYDRTVPIILSGPHIKPGTYATRAEVIDIAPTLSFIAGVVPPSLSEGRVLSEILETR